MSKTINIKVKGMSCSHCENTVSNAAMSIEGVKAAKAVAKKERLTIKVTDESVVSKVKQAIMEADFEVID